MADVIRDPKIHFTRAAELAERSKFFAIRAKEAAITNKVAGALLAQESMLDRQYALWHVAQALKGLALQMEVSKHKRADG